MKRLKTVHTAQEEQQLRDYVETFAESQFTESEARDLIQFIFGDETEFDAHKKCSKCKEILPISEFGKRAAAHDGLQGYCKTCKKDDDKKWRDSNPEYMKAYGDVRRDEAGYNVYVIENLFGEVYVGVFKGPIEDRFHQHITKTEYSVRKEEHLNKLQHSLHTHGAHNHTLSLYRELGDVSKEEAEYQETLLIHKFQRRGYTMLNSNKLLKN